MTTTATAVRDAASWALAYARRTMPRPRAVRCTCASLARWEAVAAYRWCRRDCAAGWLEN